MKIYCDTSALPHNIMRHPNAKRRKELDALGQLAEKYSMFASRIVHHEAEKTKDVTQRDHLITEYKALQAVPNDQKLLGFNSQTVLYGGFMSFPLISDVQDETLRHELIGLGLKRRDAEHITQAICNDCDVFLTLDENSLINRLKRHGEWLEKRFPKFKVLLPSQLLELIARDSMTPP